MTQQTFTVQDFLERLRASREARGARLTTRPAAIGSRLEQPGAITGRVTGAPAPAPASALVPSLERLLADVEGGERFEDVASALIFGPERQAEFRAQEERRVGVVPEPPPELEPAELAIRLREQAQLIRRQAGLSQLDPDRPGRLFARNEQELDAFRLEAIADELTGENIEAATAAVGRGLTLLNTLIRTAGTAAQIAGRAAATQVVGPGGEALAEQNDFLLSAREVGQIPDRARQAVALERLAGREVSVDDFLSIVQDAADTPPGVQGATELAIDLLIPIAPKGVRQFVGAGMRAGVKVSARIPPVLANERGFIRLPSGLRRRVPPTDPGVPETPLQQLTRAIQDEDLGSLRERTQKAFSLEAWYDRNFPLADLQKQTGVPVRDLAQLVPSATAVGQNTLERFFYPVVRRLGKDISLDDLERYMVIRRAEDVLSRNPGATLPGKLDGWQGVLAAKRELLGTLGPERAARIEEVGTELWRLEKEHVLGVLEEGGLISARQRVAIAADNPHYIPWRRADFVDNIDQAFSKSELSVGSTGIRELSLEGSERAISKPLERFFSGPVRATMVVWRNRAARSVVEALATRQRQTGDILVRAIETGGELQRAARVTGGLVAKEPVPGRTGTVTFFEDGVKQIFEVPEEFAIVARGLGADPDNMLLKFFRVANAPLRHGATEFNPFFIPVNIMRDSQAALFRENLVPFGQDWFAGLWAAIRKNTLFDEAAQAGVFMSGQLEVIRAGRGVERAAVGSLQIRNVKDAIMLIPRVISEANITVERGVRVATFRKLGRIEGLDPLKRVIRTRDATVDFSKSGNAMRVVNQVIPFTNAATQGLANMIRTSIEHPLRSAAYGFAFASVTAATRINNMRFETNVKIPDFEYTRNWVVQFGEGTYEDGTKFPLYVKIPKGEIASMFAYPAEVLYHLAREEEDRSSVELMIEQGLEQIENLAPVPIPIPGIGGRALIPPVPFIQTGVGLATGIDPFRQAPIVPRREEALQAGQQFGPETSAFAVAIGQKFNVSPRLIQFAISDMLGGAGQSSNWLLGQALEALGVNKEVFGAAVSEEGEPSTVATVAQVPGVRRFFGKRDTQQIRRGWERFNRVFDETNREFNTIPGVNALGIRLGEASARVSIIPRSSGTSVDLEPAQRADWQRILGRVVTPAIRELSDELANVDMTNEERKQVLQAEMRTLKVRAREQMLDELEFPDPPKRPAGGWYPSELLRAREALKPYLTVVEDIIGGDEALAVAYDEWRSLNSTSERDSFRGTHPLGEDAAFVDRLVRKRRAALRDGFDNQSRLIDAALVVWSGMVPRHIENQFLERIEGRDAVIEWLRQEIAV